MRMQAQHWQLARLSFASLWACRPARLSDGGIDAASTVGQARHPLLGHWHWHWRRKIRYFALFHPDSPSSSPWRLGPACLSACVFLFCVHCPLSLQLFSLSFAAHLFPLLFDGHRYSNTFSKSYCIPLASLIHISVLCRQFLSSSDSRVLTLHDSDPCRPSYLDSLRTKHTLLENTSSNTVTTRRVAHIAPCISKLLISNLTWLCDASLAPAPS